MFKSFFYPNSKKITTVTLITEEETAGYYSPVSAHQLLMSNERQQWLKMIWDYSSLPLELYTRYHLRPLEQCIALLQNFPATESAHYAYLGGLIDHTLATIAYASRLSKNYLLPLDLPPEDQSIQSAGWNSVIFYAALFQSLEGLSGLKVELRSGRLWVPLSDPPKEPYRFRFLIETSERKMRNFHAMRAFKLTPNETILWLSEWPEALNTLMDYLSGFRAESGIVNSIVSDAIKASIEYNSIKRPSTQPPTSIRQSPLEQTISSFSFSSNPLLKKVTADQSLDSDNRTPLEFVLEPQLLQTKKSESRLNSILEYAMQVDSKQSEQKNDLSYSAPTNISLSSDDIGDYFWQWLVEGCQSGRLAINTPKARVHTLAGFVFIQTPAIFYQFFSENTHIESNKFLLQKSFERLGQHRKKPTSLFTCLLYENALHTGSFKKLSGYLIVAKNLYIGLPVPKDNPLLTVQRGN